MATVPFDGVSFKSRPFARRGLWWKVAFGSAVATVGGWWVFGDSKPVADRGAVASAIVTRSDAAAQQGLQGTAALERCRSFLDEAQSKLDSVSAMTAVFQKQERIDGALAPLHVMELKCRREPFSVYMKWREPDEGQEVIWCRDQFDGKIVVCPAGWKRKVMRMVKIDPDSDQAMAASRRPISSSGIWNFTARLRETIEQELMRDPTVQISQSSGAEISGRPCDKFVFERPTQGAAGDFHRMIVYADGTLGVPVALEHYRWNNDAEGRLASLVEESYLFRDLNLGAELSDVDFDEENPAYEFIKK